ncbi:hypothetical protein B566_EDAN010982 [Ephemera danica]|nr:hypothetical protein B566_EDAN010982 [Ephemera danica]
MWHVKFTSLTDLVKYLHTTSVLPYQNITLRDGAFPEIPNSIRDHDTNEACGPLDLIMESREDILHNEYVAMKSYDGM